MIVSAADLKKRATLALTRNVFRLGALISCGCESLFISACRSGDGDEDEEAAALVSNTADALAANKSPATILPSQAKHSSGTLMKRTRPLDAGTYRVDSRCLWRSAALRLLVAVWICSGSACTASTYAGSNVPPRKTQAPCWSVATMDDTGRWYRLARC
jgi:hypothetical protein